jgi:hypothetical protein
MSLSLLVLLALLAVVAGAAVGMTASRSLEESGRTKNKRPADKVRSGAARVASSVWWWWRKRGKTRDE